MQRLRHLVDFIPRWAVAVIRWLPSMSGSLVFLNTKVHPKQILRKHPRKILFHEVAILRIKQWKFFLTNEIRRKVCGVSMEIPI